MANLPPALKFTSLGVRFWGGERNNPKDVNPPKVVFINGEALIKVLNFNGEEIIYSLEDLWALGSSVVMDRFRKPMRIAQEVFYYRGILGNEVIRKIWRDKGFTNRGETVKSIKILPTLSPVPQATKANRKASLAKDQVLPILRFGMFNDRLSWALMVEGANDIFAQVNWNDIEGITNLANKVLEREYCLTMFAMTNPKESAKLLVRKTKYNNNVILWKFLQRYEVKEENAHRELFTEFYKEYENTLIRTLNRRQALTGGMDFKKFTNPDSYDKSFLLYGLLELGTRENKNYGSLLGDTKANPKEEQKQMALQRDWEAKELLVWNKYKTKVEALGISLIELPLDPEKPRMIHKAVIAIDKDIYLEFEEEDGLWPKLMARANKVLAEEAI